MEEQLYVVWVRMKDGWVPSKPMSLADAERDVKTLFVSGAARIHPSHSITLADIIEG